MADVLFKNHGNLITSAPASPAFSCPGTSFVNTTFGDSGWFSRGSALIGSTTSLAATVSFWLKSTTFTGNQNILSFITSGGASILRLFINDVTSSTYRMDKRIDAGQGIPTLNNSMGTFTMGTWHHYMITWLDDINNPGRIIVYQRVDDGDNGDKAELLAGSGPFEFIGVDFTETAQVTVGNLHGTSSNEPFDGCLGCVYINTTESIGPLTVEANRRKVIDSSNKPEDLGSDGSTPTGNQPIAYFSGEGTPFKTNLGTGGAFGVAGENLVACADSPSD